MSLRLRHHLYYNFCITARFHLSPAPTSVKEVQFIRDSFEKIAPIEYFSVELAKNSPSNPFRQHVTVVMNASDQLCQLNPFNGIDESIKPSASFLLQRQHDISKYLLSICGLPRYSYIEHDQRYFDGGLCVPFRHTLTPDARYLMQQYEISDSTADSPFFILLSDHDLKTVGSKIRHNFQKFHKIKPVRVKKSLHRLYNDKDLFKEKINIDVGAGNIIDASAIMDLNTDLDLPVPSLNQSDFNGFQGT